MALILVALLLCYAGYAGAPAVAQYDVPPEGQYGLPADGQYESPPPTTAPLPEEEQYGAPPEDQNGGGGTNGDNGGTTAPFENGNDDGGDREDGAAARTPDRPSENAALPEYLDGVLVDGLKLLAVLSVVTTLLFFVERSQDRRGW